MKLADFEEWLNNFLNFEKTQKKNIFWLETMNFLCEKFSNPQNEIPCVHIAGSKGKGSTSVMIASILEEAGYKCGIYTSPHIIDFRERIKRPFCFFEDWVYEQAADELVLGIESILPEELPGQRAITWFELVTVYSFLCFKIAKVDYVVYEVGLGGRLDSTNVVTPLLSCIMPIELEHTEFLGNTVELIAEEKAGIIKKDIPVLISFQKYENVCDVFVKKCKNVETKCTFLDTLINKIDFSFDNARMNLTFSSNLFLREIKTSLKLLGKVQAENACFASCAVKLINSNISEKTIEDGLSKAYISGRYELIDYNGIPIVLDGAHTPNSIRNTVETTKKIFPDWNITLLFGCASDKDIKDIIPLFDGFVSEVFITKPNFSRAIELEKLQTMFNQLDIACKVFENSIDAINTILNKTKTDKNLVLVTGSFYLVSDVVSQLSVSK